VSRITGGLAVAPTSGGGGGGGFAWPVYDWAEDAAVGFGVGAADFPVPVDLSTLDGGVALATLDRSADNKVLRLRPPAAATYNTLKGAVLYTVDDAENGCWAMRCIVRLTATAADVATPGVLISVRVGLGLFREAEAPATWGYHAAILNSSNSSQAVLEMRLGSNANRTDINLGATAGVGSIFISQPFDVFCVRTGSDVEFAYGLGGAVTRFVTADTSHSGPGAVCAVASSNMAANLDVLVVRAAKLAALPTGP